MQSRNSTNRNFSNKGESARRNFANREESTHRKPRQTGRGGNNIFDNKRSRDFTSPKQSRYDIEKPVEEKQSQPKETIRDVLPYNPAPVTRNYSTAFKSNEIINGNDAEYTLSNNAESSRWIKYGVELGTPNFQQRISTQRRTVRNQIPKNRNIGIDSWSHIYSEHLDKLKNIFIRGTRDILFSQLNLNSSEFDNLFFKFIRESSSGEISRYL